MNTKKTTVAYHTYHLLLNQQHFELKHQQRVTTRVLHHWRKKGMLEDRRDKPASGHRNYYSLIDLVWISIIADLRHMQVEIDKIKSGKHGVFAPIKADNTSCSALEYYIMHIFEYNVPVFIVVTDTDQLLMINDMVYFDKLRSGEIANHIAISLNKQIKDVLSELYITPDFSEFSGLTDKEMQVLYTIRSNTFKYINVTKKNGEITRLEGTEQITKSSRIADLLKKGEYQNLEIKQHNGKIVCINRTIRKKITT
jgi:hypothetical protein